MAQPPTRETVRVPASTANLGPGFDCLGLALDITDDVTVAFAGAPPSPAGSPAEAAHRDLIALAAARVYIATGQEAPPLDVAVRHGIPIGKGMGSSAAAICRRSSPRTRSGARATPSRAPAPISPRSRRAPTWWATTSW